MSDDVQKHYDEFVQHGAGSANSDVVYQRLETAAREYCKLVETKSMKRNHTHLSDLAVNFIRSFLAVESLEQPGKRVFERLQIYFPGLRAEGLNPSDKLYHWKRLYTATTRDQIAREALDQCPDWLRPLLVVGTSIPRTSLSFRHR